MRRPGWVRSDFNRPTGHAIARAIAGAGINLAFFVAQVVGRKYSAVIGFDRDDDGRRAAVHQEGEPPLAG